MDPIRVTVGVDGGHYLTSFDFGVGSFSVRTADPYDTTGNVRRYYLGRLREARARLGAASPGCTVAQAFAFLKDVHDLGSELQEQFFGNDLPKVSQGFADALRARGAEPLDAEARLVVLDCGGLFFPLEIMPLLDVSEIVPTARETDLYRRARSFVGLSAVVQRTLRREVDQNQFLDCNPKLPIKLFYHAGLRAAHDEADFFRDHPAIALDGPWPAERPGESATARIKGLWRFVAARIGIPTAPSVVDATEVPRAFTRYLMEPHRAFDGTARQPPDQICHFSCHCGEDAGDYKLIMRAGNGAEVAVRISEMRRYIAQGNYRAQRVVRPFVFLNACLTGANQLGDFARFESFFESTLHRGLITTEAEVPDGFAAPLAKVFYDHLLSEYTVGQSLHRARWDLLTLVKNPFGLLYFLYGEPNLRLRHPIGVRQAARVTA